MSNSCKVKWTGHPCNCINAYQASPKLTTHVLRVVGKCGANLPHQFGLVLLEEKRKAILKS